MTKTARIKSVSFVFKICASLAVTINLFGCTALNIARPVNGSTVTLPDSVEITESVGLDGRAQSPRKIFVDGQDVEHFNNVNYSVPSGSTLCCLLTGNHSVSVEGHVSTRVITASSNFTVSGDWPDKYSCPTGSVHPIFGVCCDNGSCDIPAASNFGPWRFPSSSCPTSQSRANDCLNQNANGICGATGVGCSGLTSMATQMLAVGFKTAGGVLKQIHVPLGWRSGTNSFRAWIAADNGGQPGTILESFSLLSVRQQSFPVRSSLHIFSQMHPNLTAGATYWLIIGPGAANTVGSWNNSLDDAPAAGSTNFLVNTTPDASGVPQLTGPWTPALPGTPAPGDLRPAFQIDIR